MLIDEAMRVAARHPNGDWFLPMLKKATVVKIQNVADYIFESPLEKWDIEKDFPNISPPFELIWFEWRQNADWCFDGNQPSWMLDRYPMSLFLASIDIRQYGDDLPDLKEWLTESSPDIRWVTFGHFYWDAGRAFSSPPAFGWGVSEEGQFRPIGGGFQTRLNPLCPVETNPTEKDFEEASGLQALLPIAFMALSFMHCKNVQVVEGPAWPARLQKAREKRGKPPLVSWKTLVIDPVKSIIASHNSGNPALNPKSLHICRGHFKDFTQKGLFGRYHGRYWWPMQTRGSAQFGEVKKDYLVKAGSV